MNHCIFCNRRYDETVLLESVNNEFFCKECFRRRFLSSKKCEGESVTECKKMFSSDKLSTVKQNRDKGNALSKKPLQCPHNDCNRYVSVFDLITHFQHEHREVPITQAILDARNPLTFNPKDVQYGDQRCMVLLNLTKSPQVPIAVAVLASRISSLSLIQENDDIVLEDEAANNCGDKIIIWAASNVVCNYSSTVAVSTAAEDIRLKYYGPIHQLGRSPVSLCTSGHCLILSHFHFEGMSKNGLKPLKLDVIVHSEE